MSGFPMTNAAVYAIALATTLEEGCIDCDFVGEARNECAGRCVGGPAAIVIGLLFEEISPIILGAAPNNGVFDTRAHCPAVGKDLSV